MWPRVRFAAVGAVLTVLSALALAPHTASAAPTEPLGHAGRWFIDAQGRVVVLHGFNTVPVNEATLPLNMGMGPDNARWLAENGFNTIRLGFYYARFEPQPGVFDDAYLDDYVRVHEELAREGIFTMLDAHQDQLHPRYGTSGVLPSRGFPAWFLREDGLPNTATPYPAGYQSNPALNRAFDHIWQNSNAPDGIPLQEHFARGWQRIVARFRSRSHLLGYDFFNEPWPGTVWPTCANPVGCPPGGFDQTLLTAFNRRMVAAIRAADPTRLIFHEPNLLFDFGAPTAIGDAGDPNVGFAFHNYCLAIAVASLPDPFNFCAVNEALPNQNAEAHAARTGDALILSEFGFEPDDARRVTAAADRAMLSWQRWDYYGDFDLGLQGRLDDLVRAYPQVVAGTPRSWFFDPGADTFELTYSTIRAAGEGSNLRPAATAPGERFPAGSRTEVFVPERHFPRGYRVDVDGAEVVSAPGARLLVLASCAGRERVTLNLTADGHARRPPNCERQAVLRGAAPRRCLPRRLAVSRRGIGPLRLGRRLRPLERRYRVTRRTRRSQRFCVRGKGRVVVGVRRGRVRLVASTAPRHRTRRARPGQRVTPRALRGTTRVAKRLYVGHVGGRNRVVYGVRAGKVRFLAVVRRSAAARPRALSRRLGRLGVLR